MKFIEFKNGLDNGKVFPIYLLTGEDAYFRERSLLLLKNKFLSEPSVNFVKFDGKDCDLNEVLASFSMYPFMSEKRITLIEEFYPNKEAINIIKEFLKNPPEYGLLVISNQKDAPALKSVADVCVVECVKADTTSVIRWIKAKCAEEKVEIEYETAKLVADYCLCDMTRVVTETEKLLAYSLNDGKIINETVNLLVSRDTDYKIYEMTDCIGRREFNSALAIITDLLRKDDNALGIISGVYRHFRRLLHTCISGLSNKELSEYFGIKEFAVEKLRVQASKFKPKALKKAVDSLADADFKIKCGEMNEQGATWGTLFRIMTE